MGASSPIRAAGVVLLREGTEGQEFLLVHRPGRADWSLPKGKIEAGEHAIAAAVRECDEESGYSPILMAPLPMQSYSIGSQPKVVHYWRARIREELGFAPDDEVDEILWLPVSEAPGQLTYPSEVGLVDIAASLEDTVPLVILRHSQALKRSQFDGKIDSERPLSGKGRTHSKALVGLLEAYGITSLHSSPSRRCVDTLKRYAKSADQPVQTDQRLSEESFDDDPDASRRAAVELALTPEPLALCSHRPVLPAILEAVAAALGMDPDDRRWRKDWDAKLPTSGFLVVHRAFDEDGNAHVVAIEQHSLSGIGGN